MALEYVLNVESSLTDRYQTTVPEPIRLALKLGKRDKLRYSVKPTGEVTITRVEADEDPAIGAFLDFLERDIQRNPQRLSSLSPALMERVKELTQGVEVDLDAPLSPDDE
jgi:antitoxin PrlF